MLGVLHVGKPRYASVVLTLSAALAAVSLTEGGLASAASKAQQLNTIPSGSKLSPRSEESTEKLRQDADAGDADAQLLLGIRYLQNTRELPPNPEEAMRWFRKAAEQGHPLGIMRIKAAYYQGQGVPRDGVEVCKWGIIAAALATNERDREGLKTSTEALAKDLNLTSEQRAEGEKRAKEWLEAFKKRDKKK